MCVFVCLCVCVGCESYRIVSYLNIQAEALVCRPQVEETESLLMLNTLISWLHTCKLKSSKEKVPSYELLCS